MEKELRSKHIFIFPFKIENIKENAVTYYSFKKKTDLDLVNSIIKENGEWMLETYSDLFSSYDEKKIDLSYNTKLYFYESVRNAIFTYFNKDDPESLSDEIILNYNYKINEDPKYHIKTFDKEYILDIKKIGLKIFETGVGVLSFFLDNYNEEYDKDDILKINALGRNVYLPFIEAKEAGEIPEYIEITGLNGKNTKEDFEFGEKYSKDTIKLSNIITDILGFGSFGSKIEILPLIDHRMFVMSVNNELGYFNKYENVSDLDEVINNDEYLYKFIFIDSGKLKCQNKKMLNKSLKESTYKRWIDKKSVFGISRYSFVLLKEDNQMDALNNHMETLYFEMVALVLAQRVSLLNFSDEISRISRLDEKDSKRILNLYQNYLQFSNRMFFRQVSAQEQGIELYNTLFSKSDILLLIEDLNKEMESLHEYARLSNSDQSQKSLEMIENLNKWLLVPTFVTGLLGINIFQSKFHSIDTINPFSIKFFTSFGFWFSMSLLTFLMFAVTKIILIIFEKKLFEKK